MVAAPQRCRDCFITARPAPSYCDDLLRVGTMLHTSIHELLWIFGLLWLCGGRAEEATEDAGHLADGAGAFFQ
jgi:hypothetical protein